MVQLQGPLVGLVLSAQWPARHNPNVACSGYWEIMSTSFYYISSSPSLFSFKYFIHCHALVRTRGDKHDFLYVQTFFDLFIIAFSLGLHLDLPGPILDLLHRLLFLFGIFRHCTLVARDGHFNGHEMCYIFVVGLNIHPSLSFSSSSASQLPILATASPAWPQPPPHLPSSPSS